jgi:hypothetical protein
MTFVGLSGRMVRGVVRRVVASIAVTSIAVADIMSAVGVSSANAMDGHRHQPGGAKDQEKYVWIHYQG